VRPGTQRVSIDKGKKREEKKRMSASKIGLREPRPEKKRVRNAGGEYQIKSKLGFTKKHWGGPKGGAETRLGKTKLGSKKH